MFKNTILENDEPILIYIYIHLWFRCDVPIVTTRVSTTNEMNF